MLTATPQKIAPIGTLQIGNEKFVFLKKEYLNELLLLMKGFVIGEKMIKEGKTRSFSDFLQEIAEKKR